MAKYLQSMSVSITANGVDQIKSVTAAFRIRDSIDLSYSRTGSFTITSLIPIYHEAIRRIIEEAQDQICVEEGLSCTSSSSPSIVL